jgi:hypothetical protein
MEGMTVGDSSIESRLRAALARDNHEICQTLGKALGYAPHYPVVSDVADGTVCVGDHVAASIAAEAARRIEELEAEVARLMREREDLIRALDAALRIISPRATP